MQKDQYSGNVGKLKNYSHLNISKGKSQLLFSVILP